MKATEKMKRTLVVLGLSLLSACLFMIVKIIVIRIIVHYNIPSALLSLLNWTLLILVLWVPRPVFYSTLIASQLSTFYFINIIAPEKGNAYAGSILNFIFIIVLAEVYKISYDRIKRINIKLVAERERADEATRRKDVFMAKMSHELRTPLNGIKGIANLLLETDECKEKRKNLQMICDAADSLQYIIDDLLDLSKIEMGITTFNNKPFCLKGFLEVLSKQFSLEAQNKNLLYTCSLSDELPECILMDNYRLRQIISNLLTNAIKYTQEGGEITFAVKAETDSDGRPILVMNVTDTGVGIAEEDLDRIYDSFYRSFSSYNNQTSGVGLGLHIVKHLVEFYNGNIDVKTTVGMGTTFTIKIPVKVVDHIDEKTSDLYTSDSKHSHMSLDILVAEDNAINSFFIKNILEKRNHAVELVDNGNDAVKKIKERAYDLVFMDIQMPGVSGIEAVKRIREYEKEKGLNPLCIAAITAYATSNEKDIIINSGFDFYMTKPVEPSKLGDILERAKQLKGEVNKKIENWD